MGPDLMHMVLVAPVPALLLRVRRRVAQVAGQVQGQVQALAPRHPDLTDLDLARGAPEVLESAVQGTAPAKATPCS